MDEENYDGVGPINEKLIKFKNLLRRKGKNILFFNHKSNIEVTKQLYAWLKKYNQIPNVQLQNKKDNEKAKNLRMKGRTQFTSILNTLDNLNICICCAEGEELALAYASRSNVYLACKKYDLCLENIELALKAGYPQSLMDKLITKRSLCIEFLNYSNQSTSAERVDEHSNGNEINNLQKRRDALKVTLSSIGNLSFAVDSLELMYNSVIGRHYVAKRDLYPGYIVSVEEPFVNVLTKSYRYRKCANCFKENYMSLIPCKTCTYTMFCSEKCMNEAQKFHKFECPILEYIWEECEEYALTLRLVLKAFTVFDSVDELIKFHNENTIQNVELIHYGNYFNDKQRYTHVAHLQTNEDKRNTFDMFLRCCKVALLYHFLMERTEFSQMIQTKLHRDTLISIILQHSQIASINAIPSCQTNTLHLEHFLNQELKHVFAEGIYAFSSLYNHSCIPNTATVFYQGKLVTYVTRPIKQFSEAYTSYHRVIHTNDKTASRRNFLDVFFHFICNCQACLNDYPTYKLALSHSCHTKPELELSVETIDVNKDIDNIEKLCTLLTLFDSEYPCPYLSRLWLRFKRAMTCNFGELSTGLQLSLGEQINKVLEEKKSSSRR